MNRNFSVWRPKDAYAHCYSKTFTLQLCGLNHVELTGPVKDEPPVKSQKRGSCPQCPRFSFIIYNIKHAERFSTMKFGVAVKNTAFCYKT